MVGWLNISFEWKNLRERERDVFRCSVFGIHWIQTGEYMKMWNTEQLKSTSSFQYVKCGNVKCEIIFGQIAKYGMLIFTKWSTDILKMTNILLYICIINIWIFSLFILILAWREFYYHIYQNSQNKWTMMLIIWCWMPNAKFRENIQLPQLDWVCNVHCALCTILG